MAKTRKKRKIAAALGALGLGAMALHPAGRAAMKAGASRLGQTKWGAAALTKTAPLRGKLSGYAATARTRGGELAAAGRTRGSALVAGGRKRLGSLSERLKNLRKAKTA